MISCHTLYATGNGRSEARLLAVAERNEVEKRKRSKAEPSNVPLPQTLEWAFNLPRDVQPRELIRSFGRIANLLVANWGDAEATAACFSQLLVDTRGGRSGFPPKVSNELIALLGYYALPGCGIGEYRSTSGAAENHTIATDRTAPTDPKMDACSACRALIDAWQTVEPHPRLQSYGELELYADFNRTTYECADCHTTFERREAMPRRWVKWRVMNLLSVVREPPRIVRGSFES